MLTGYTALVDELELAVQRPHTESRIAGTVRRTEVHADRTLETFAKQQLHDGGFRNHLLFALKNEPTELGVLAAAFKKVGPQPIESWVHDEPTGAYARRAWFLYEFLTGTMLDLPNAKRGAYPDVLDPKRHIVGPSVLSSRHRVRNNLLGVRDFCPTIRRTTRLARRINEKIDEQAARLTQSVDPELLRRAVSYLYTKETRSSFEIEREVQNPKREERFVAALARAAQFDFTDKAALVSLQNTIVDARYAASDWRTDQNFVGETVSGYREVVHLICPKPGDVPALMAGWRNAAARLLAGQVDAVAIAALLSFGFVFVHPFEDGNGRIHRFIIHSVLAKTGFSPKDVIFPVSVAIVRDLPAYDAALETFSKPLLSLIDYRFGDDGKLTVTGDTADYYRYFDATPLAEFLYDRVAETVHRDLAQELDFLGSFDRAYHNAREVVDMPNNRLSLFVRLVMQNGGRIARAKRKQFAELSDDEVLAMEAAVRAAAVRPETDEER